MLINQIPYTYIHTCICAYTYTCICAYTYTYRQRERNRERPGSLWSGERVRDLGVTERLVERGSLERVELLCPLIFLVFEEEEEEEAD